MDQHIVHDIKVRKQFHGLVVVGWGGSQKQYKSYVFEKKHICENVATQHLNNVIIIFDSDVTGIQHSSRQISFPYHVQNSL